MAALNEEQKLIAKIKSLVGSGGRFIGDDCAVLPGKQLVTTDALVEQVHFNLEWTSLFDLGWKSMAVNLSDIAAMAGIPKYALIVINAPEALYKTHKIISLYEGIAQCAKSFNTVIIGGDITRGTGLTITVTVIGQASQWGVLLRSGAKVGDVILVTGDFGASNAGLRILQSSFAKSSEYDYCFKQFCKPIPKLDEAQLLIERIGGRGALMDTSDGLADALLQISKASGVGMQINLDTLPIHEQTRLYAKEAKLNPHEMALYGGEDYQLLLGCISAKDWSVWQEEKPDINRIFTQIGYVNDSNDVQLMFGKDEAYKLDPKRIFQHIS